MSTSVPTCSLLILLLAQSIRDVEGSMPVLTAVSFADFAQTIDSAIPVIKPRVLFGNRPLGHTGASTWASRNRHLLPFLIVDDDYDDASDLKAPYNAPLGNKESLTLPVYPSSQRKEALKRSRRETDTESSLVESITPAAFDQIEGLFYEASVQGKSSQRRSLSSLPLTRKTPSSRKTDTTVKKTPRLHVKAWTSASKDEATRRQELADYFKEVEAAVLANPRKPINAALEAGAKIIQRNAENYCIAQNIKCTPTTQLPTAVLHALLEDSPASEFLAAIEEKLSEIERALTSTPSGVKNQTATKISSNAADNGSSSRAKAWDSSTSRDPPSSQEDEDPRDDTTLPGSSNPVAPLFQFMRASDQAIGDALGDILSGFSVPSGIRSVSWVLLDRKEECSMSIQRTPTEMSKCKSFVVETPVPPAIVLQPPSLNWRDPLSIRQLFVWGFELSCLSQLGCSSATQVLQPDVFDGLYAFSHFSGQDGFVFVKDFDETPATFYTGDKVHKFFLVVSKAPLELPTDEARTEENRKQSVSAAILPSFPDIEVRPLV